MCCFGAVGFLCWIMHAAIAGYWAVTADDRHDIKDRSYRRFHGRGHHLVSRAKNSNGLGRVIVSV